MEYHLQNQGFFRPGQGKEIKDTWYKVSNNSERISQSIEVASECVKFKPNFKSLVLSDYSAIQNWTGFYALALSQWEKLTFKVDVSLVNLNFAKR